MHCRNKGKGKGKSVELQSDPSNSQSSGLRKRDYSELSGDEMDVDETKPKVEPDDSVLPGTSNRKRKRGDTDLSRAVSQSSRAGDSARSKRSRSVVSTATHSRFNPGDRVFAFHDDLFYPATFEEEVGDDYGFGLMAKVKAFEPRMRGLLPSFVLTTAFPLWILALTMF